MGRAQARKFISRRIATPIALGMGRIGMTPNSLTLFGLVIAGVGAYLASIGQFWGAGAVLVFAAVFDLFDGALARATDRVTVFGAMLDSVIDRVSEAIVLLGLLVYYLDRDDDVGIVLVYLAFVFSVLVSYARARSEGLGVDCTVGVMTRPERVIVMAVGLVGGHWAPNILLAALGIIVALSALTSIQRVLHAKAALRDRG